MPTSELKCPLCGCDVLKVLADEVESLINEASIEAVRRAGHLPPLPPAASLQDQHLWREVRQSYILGQFAAALLLSTSYLEFLLNATLSSPKPLMLRAAIDAARLAKLIDEETAEGLVGIARRIRNAYAHGDLDRITGVKEREVTAQLVTVRAGGSVTIGPVESVSLDQIPFAQTKVKADMDAAAARPVLQTIYAVAYELVARRAR